MVEFDRKTKNIIEYILVCIDAFAEDTEINIQEAYRYLKEFGGIKFLFEFYDIEHTLSIENAVDDLKLICENKGGQTPEGSREYTPKFLFQIECVAKNLMTMLMEKYLWDTPTALDRLCESETFDRLIDPECGLYYESPVYVFSFLKSEIETGSLSDNGYI